MGVTDVLFNAVKNCSQRKGTDAEISQGKKCAIKGYAVRHNSVSRDSVAAEIKIEEQIARSKGAI
jgi:hypothetical protein